MRFTNRSPCRVPYDMHFMYMQYKHHDNGKQNSQLQISKKTTLPETVKNRPPKKMDGFFWNPMNFPNLGPMFAQVQGLGFYLLFVSGSPGKLVFLVHLQLAMKAQEQSFSQDFRLKECLQRRFGWQARWVKHLRQISSREKLPGDLWWVSFKNGIYISTVSISKNPCIII